MLQGLIHLHNALRWVILILLLISLIQAFTKNGGIQKTSLWLLIAAHITLNSQAVGFHLIELKGGFGEVMKDSFARFWVVEHITAMILAIVLITIARGKAKTLNFNAAKWLYLVALILLLAAIPWPFREGIGRPWFPGM